MRREASWPVAAARAAAALGAPTALRGPGAPRDRRATGARSARPGGARRRGATLDRDGAGGAGGPLATTPARRRGPGVSTLAQPRVMSRRMPTSIG